MKNAFILIAAIIFLSACKTTEEKQAVSPIALSEELKAKVILKNGEVLTVTNRLNNINVADIEKITLLNEDASWEIFYKDDKMQLGDLKLRKNTSAPIDRNKVLVVVDGVKTLKSYDMNTLSPNSIKSINVYKGSSVKEKFNTVEFESVIEIFTK
jgi:hypothetical protein